MTMFLSVVAVVTAWCASVTAVLAFTRYIHPKGR